MHSSIIRISARSTGACSSALSAAACRCNKQQVWKRGPKRPGGPIREGYVLSEPSRVPTCDSPAASEWSGTIGLPMPSTDISIRDDDNNEVPLGELGEICARGPQ